MSVRRLAQRPGVAASLMLTLPARHPPPEHAGAYRAIMLSSRQRRTATREMLLAATLSGTPPGLGAIPVTVISADLEDPTWGQVQAEPAALSDTSTRLAAEGSSHYVHLDDPDLVLRAIRDLVREVSSR